MKQYIQLSLLALLIVLLYQVPDFLQGFAASGLGKLLLIGATGIILNKFGKLSGLLAGLVVIVLFHKVREGMEFKLPSVSLKIGGDGKEGYTNIKQWSNKLNLYEVSTQNQVDNDGDHKFNAERATVAASKQSNEVTN